MSEGELHDAPNQQVVRPDGSGPGDEGTGGSTRAPEAEKRGPGRPKGSKNRTKNGDDEPEEDEG